MAAINQLNVYKGPKSMADYFNPDIQPHLPLVEIPDKLNPFRSDGVRIYAKMATALPAQNLKCLPALNMLLNRRLDPNDTIIEQSSGSTATSLGMIARVLYNNENTRAYVSNKAGPNRIKQLRFFGLGVELYSGPSQPEINDPRGTVRRALALSQEGKGFVNPGQYHNEDNWGAHVRWTGPQLWTQLPEINVFSMAMGTAGCITGTSSYLKSQKPSIKTLGVCNPVGDPIPGPRTLPLVEMCSFPWKGTVDAVENTGSEESYRLSMLLSREGLICGPSSGMTLEGLFEFLRKAKDAGTLHEYAEPGTGEVSCVFVCCDLPYQYLDGYYDRLGEEDFPPILNKELLHLDINEYDSKWELDIDDTKKLLLKDDCESQDRHLWTVPVDEKFDLGSNNGLNRSGPVVLDFRSPEDYDRGHIPSSFNTPLEGLTKECGSPFDGAKVLEKQWKSLTDKCAEEGFSRLLAQISPKGILLVCYNGETSRLAAAMMQAQGINCYSIRGGARMLGGLP